MIAKQSVYLAGDRSKAVPEGDKDARFLLVREGHEVNEAEVEKYDAMSLVTSESKTKPEPRPAIPPPTFKKFGKEAEQEQKEEPKAPAPKVAKKPRAKKSAK